MSVHPVDAERRACSPSSATSAVARGPMAATSTANGGNRALRLVQIDQARLAALLHDAQQRGDAFGRVFPGALGAVCIGAAGSPADAMARMLAAAAPDLPLAPVQMALLDAGSHARAGAVCEIWQCDARDLRSERRGALQYRYSATAGLVFGSIVVQEAQAAHEAQESADADRDGGTPLERTTYDAYRALFDVLDTLGIPHPLRIWNTVPAINAQQFGIERYRQFNIGRQRAFDACRRALTGGVPAACALGSVVPVAGDMPPAAPLAIHFIASRAPADPVENPRQVSAYHYPAEYGPRAPTFARAAAWPGDAAAPLLFVSGTASIVGHRTVHHGDVVAQTRETLANLAAVLEQAARQGHGPFTLADLSYRVYVRDAGDAAALAAIERTLRDAAGPGVRPLFVHADVCRDDLLVEIEASAGHPLEHLS
ncbi:MULTISPECIES: endoribonuclease L-PSP [unclassified Burkholderia]|uniref:chorismate transformation enzyme, FkbO/Hyg5 family n=1 Tax=unclassified Burkholderia TaxID=2613784 RepID=UPI000F574B76|nr:MULTISPECIES: endoribonuclease L-PSP [unclassified Burkholderia]RQR42838.1 endoribonuclease L-PSP [Burkholderia sp. Bp9131]RQR98932.1 endoribonuclease L-PSP [Burkholderia sp. Bp8994]RQS25871.1 endoribonuclease L-PSP [Burkholderia sp. Bp8995]RQS42467.1 endoribonuclease L-PSP [Burkholderia sp. Bp8990]RQS44363.1 endoribonuclease L-PSP [Burkholderia sp. Bp8989]